VIGIALLSPGTRYLVHGQVVAREYFLARALPIVVLTTGALFGIAWGLWREHRWVRPLALVSWATVVVVTTADATTRASALAASGVGCAVLLWMAWYLYATPRVRAYYAALRR
jgi:hypothetical protein